MHSYLRNKRIFKPNRLVDFNDNIFRSFIVRTIWKNIPGLILIIVCMFFELQTTLAQFKDMNFEYLNSDKGLSCNTVRCMLRDSKGYLWVGTELGLNRYDGTSVKVFLNNKSVYSSLSSNVISTLFEDRDLNLWVGTTNGLNLFDRKTETFKRYNFGESSNANLVTSTLSDENGNIWISTFNGIQRWDTKTQRFTKYRLPENFSQELAVWSMCPDFKGNLWMACNDGKIWRFIIQKEQFECFADPKIKSEGLIQSIAIDTSGTVWLGVDRNRGLYSMNPQTRKFRHFKVSLDGKGTSGQDVKGFFWDGNRYLLIAIDHGGINRLDIKNETFEYCLLDNNNLNGLNSDGLWTIYKDWEGIIYAGTFSGGVNIYNPKKQRFTSVRNNPMNVNSLTYNIVSKFFEDSKGLIWIGTDGGGLSIYNPKTKSFTNYKHNPADPNSLKGNTILGITEDKNHDIWLSLWGIGICRFDRKNNKFIYFKPDPSKPNAISSSDIYDLTCADDGRIWISSWGSGIDVFDIRKGVVMKFREDLANKSSINSNVVFCTREMTDKRILVMTMKGACIYNTSNNTFQRIDSLQNIRVNDAWYDSHHNIWAATQEEGLWIIKPNGKVERHNKSNGFISNTITGIVEDNEGNMWISSFSGLSEYRAQSNTFRHYNQLDGLQGKQFNYSRLKASDGKLYFGGFHGFNIIATDNLTDNDFLPPVYIIEFDIFNKPVMFDSPNSPLNQVISETKKLTLSYKQSVLTFGFNAINFTSPEKSLYAYKMEGYDKSWNYCDASRRYATYTNLNPGSYTFKVMASNNDGLWNPNEASISLVILPPYWLTWWFMTVCIIFLVLAVYAIFYLKTKNLQIQKISLEKTVKERTHDLSNLNEELEVINENLKDKQDKIEEQSKDLQNQARSLQLMNEDLILLNSTKDKFFSIISHDLKGPFNSILGFSEILIIDYNKMSDEERKQCIALINTSSLKVFSLLENLLTWARSQIDGIEYSPEVNNISLIIKNNIESFKEIVLKKNISIIDETIGEHYALIDINMINTVIRNLINNAIKFSYLSGCIIVKAVKVKDFVQVSIKDSGIGMNKDLQNKLFEIGEVTTREGTSKETGTGLGLILCKEFVEKNHGSLWVESKEGEGSIFIFTLPYA